MALEPESTSRRPISNALDDSARHAGALEDPRFEILQTLGAGASGTVYRARVKEPFQDLGVGRDVAVKVLRPELRQDPEARQRLAEEGRLGSALNSPNVVQIHATDPESALLVMELVPGRSLRHFLSDSGSAVEELARRIGRDAARGLAALHRLGVVHRDVKPENLALTEAGEVKVMDLGLARRLRHRRGGGAAGSGGSAGSAGFYGSLAYAAPEVLKGRRATFQSDLYSLGVVLFEVTTGQHPFFGGETDIDHRDNEVVDDIIHAHIQQKPPRPSHLKPRISAFLERLILDLLQKDPKLRPQSAAEVATAFEGGERSRYWLRHERSAPTLTSRRRLRAMRRPSDAGFVGRQAELAQLDDLLRRAMDGRGAAVQISGPRGIGRRRLLDRFLERWLDRREDLAFLGAEAGHGEGLQRTAAFSHIVLEWFLGGEREDSPKAQARLAARIHDNTELTEQEAQRVAAMACASDVDSSPEERADLVVRVVLSLSSRRHTLILRIDRAEQISTTAQLVVERLAERISEHRILLLLTSLRPEPPAPSFVNIPLRGLSEDEFVQLGEDLFRGGKTPRRLLQNAHDTLSGIPGHLLDALADLASRKRLAGRPGSYLLVDDVSELRPAGTLLDLLRTRLGELTPEQRHVHIAAAILGQQFTLGDLAALAGQPELSVLTGLSVFQGRVIVTRPGGGKFRHRDFRRAILDMVPAETRRRLHRSAAWVLEDRGAPRLDVGLHYSRAAEHDAAVDPLLDGLGQLVTAGSREQSQQVADRLLIHLDAVPANEANLDRRLRYLMLLGRAQLADRDEKAARSTYQRAASLAEVRGAAAERAEALVELGNLAMMLGRLGLAKKRLAEAETLLRQQQGAGNRMARCLSLQARVEGYLGQSEEALRLTQQALRTVDPDKTSLIAHLHVDQARLEALRNHFRAAQKSLDRANDLFQELGSAQGQLRVLLHRGHVRAHMGDRERATLMLQTAVERGHQLSDVRAQAKAMLFLGEQGLLWGDRHAKAHLFDAVTLAKEPGDHMTRVLASLYLQQLGIDVGNLEHDVQQLRVPALRVVWLLNQAQELQTDTDETSQQQARDMLAQAVRIEREITVPLHLHHRLLCAIGKQKRADHLVDDVAARLSGSKRRRFLSFMRRVR